MGPFLQNPEATAWRIPFTNYLGKVDAAIAALHNCTGTQLKKDLLLSMLDTVSAFLHSCLEKSRVDKEEWEKMNKSNFWRAKERMQAATKEQADANVRALLKWKDRLGPKLWRELYVIIPTVWPMSRTNTRLELFRGLLDTDRVETNIFCSEFPRNMDEARELLGRIVGDRGIARLVFGTECHSMRMKTVALSTQVDVVSDDAIPSIHSALKENGCEPMPYLTGKGQENGQVKECPEAIRTL